jgi:ribosomal protein S18 acetylase RimI-like enzyme
MRTAILFNETYDGTTTRKAESLPDQPAITRCNASHIFTARENPVNFVKNRIDKITYVAATRHDFEALQDLRIEAMQESLEKIGRFDPVRSRERFLLGFSPQYTRHIFFSGERAGFVVIRPADAFLQLEHLYIHPLFQKRGIGAAVLMKVFEDAERLSLPVRTGALRDSDSNKFYIRHGFVKVDESEWDIYYVRPCQSAGRTS